MTDGLSKMPTIPSANNLRTLSSAGRWGDNTVAHVQTGETLLPPELLQANPELEAALRKAFSEVGANFDDFRVGSDGMSINPETGLPEFGLFSSIKKALGKVVSKITSIPIIGPAILPAAAALIPGGPVWLPALTAGLQTKVTGGSWGEALGAGIGNYMGSYIGNSLFGSGSVPSLTGGMGPLQATSGLLGSGGNVFGASTFGDILGNGLGSTIANTSIATTIGSVLGSSMGQSLGGQLLGSSIKEPSTEQGFGNLAGINLPNNSPTLALPNDPNSTITTPTSPNLGAGDTSSVGYLTPIKDRNTGKTTYQSTNSTFGSNFGNRASTWGNGVVFA